jgi:hypothetical protein
MLFLLLMLIPQAAVSDAGSGIRTEAAAVALPSSGQDCRKLILTGEVNAGEEWSSAIGEGWVFRVVPIPSSGRGYSGWDLVVDRVPGKGSVGGYPDALLLGTPPYGSLNEREIGTTFGLRAQDAIAWGPRRFHFLTSVQSLERARALFEAVMTGSRTKSKPDSGQASVELLKLVGSGTGVAAGHFTVQDARLTAGASDAAPYAEQWAAHLPQVPHTMVQSGKAPTARGELLWMRFEAVLWLPGNWKAPRGTAAGTGTVSAKCTE